MSWMKAVREGVRGKNGVTAHETENEEDCVCAKQSGGTVSWAGPENRDSPPLSLIK